MPAPGETITIRLFDIRRDEALLAGVHATHFTSADSKLKRHSYVAWLDGNPVPGSIYLAAYVDDVFASFLGFMARDVVGFGRRFRGALAFGAMTVPAFTGRGLYSRLAHEGWRQAERDGFDFALGYTTQQRVLDLELRMGWQNLGASPVLAFPLDAPRIVRVVAPWLGAASALAAPLTPLAFALARRSTRISVPEGCVVRPIEGFSADYDGLNARMQEASMLTFAKDQHLLNWLYRSPHNPFSYDIVEARQDGTLVGFAVGRRMDLMGLDGYGILDLLAVPGSEYVLKLLAAALVQRAIAGRPQLIAMMVSAGHAAHHALRSLGFIDSRRSFTLVFRPMGISLSREVSDPANWVHCWGNNDTV